MNVLRLLPLTVAVGAALALPVQAQSLLAVYEAARAYDATWQSAKAQYDSSVYKSEQAKAAILPTVNLSSGVNRSLFELDTPSVDRGFTTQSATLSASQPLYRPANLASYKQGLRQLEIAQAQLNTASQDLILRVSQAYFDVLAAQDTLTFVRAQKTAVAEQLASAKRNFEVGTATITDTREAQARYDLVISQEIQADNDLRVKKLVLDTLAGTNDVKPDPLAVPLAVPPPTPADVNLWVEQAEQNSPAILQARVGLDIAQLETEKARAGHKPTLDLTSSYSVSRNLNGSASSTADSRSKNAAVGLSFSLPLFAGFSVQNRLKETLSLEQKAQSDLDASRRAVAQGVRTSFFNVVSGQAQVKALEAAEASSQSALDANRLGYQVGVRINIDVLNSQSQLYQTKRDLAQARYNLLLGNLKLRQSNGTLTPEDLARLSALVAAKP